MHKNYHLCNSSIKLIDLTTIELTLERRDALLAPPPTLISAPPPTPDGEAHRSFSSSIYLEITGNLISVFVDSSVRVCLVISRATTIVVGTSAAVAARPTFSE